MMGLMGPAPSVNSSIFVCNLPPGTSETLLADHFGKIGPVEKDRTSGAPLIWLYRDKVTQELNGDATVAFEDSHAAAAAVKWCNNTEFNGNIISVLPNEEAQSLNFVATSVTIGYSTIQGVPEHEINSTFAGETCGSHSGEYGGNLEGAEGPVDLEGGRGMGRVNGKPWQQEGDWPCPNSSCVNINFSFRGVCNRCGSARPSGSIASGGGVTGGGRGRSRGANDAGGRGRGSGGPPGLFGPNDWSCPILDKQHECVKCNLDSDECKELRAYMCKSFVLTRAGFVQRHLDATLVPNTRCGNINWAKRLKCNICNTSKPGYNEGGAREGRAGGFKEFDEAEIEETKRRRREKEEDDGEMYDEFGTLKKKFRTKAKPGSAVNLAVPATGVGKAGWDNDIGVVEGYTKENSKDRSAYSCSSDRHGNGKRSGYMDLKNSLLDHHGYHDKDRGWKRNQRDF